MQEVRIGLFHDVFADAEKRFHVPKAIISTAKHSRELVIPVFKGHGAAEIAAWS